MASSSSDDVFNTVFLVSEEVTNSMAPLLSSTEGFEAIDDKLPVTEKVNLRLSLAYTLASVFYSALACRGSAPQEHPVMDDLARLKTRIDRFRKVKATVNSEGKKITVDQAAALRIVSHELSLPPTTMQAKSKRTRKDDDDDDDDDKKGSLATKNNGGKKANKKDAVR